MEANGYVCLEEIEEYKYVANQNFNTEEDFFEFYNAYAFHKGFSVRKDRVRYKPSTKEVTWRRFVHLKDTDRRSILKGRIRKDSHMP